MSKRNAGLSLARGVFFEEFVDEILDELCRKHYFLFRKAEKMRWPLEDSALEYVDGYLPKGLPELQTTSAAYIEIKGTNNFKALQYHFEGLQKRLRNSAPIELVYITLCDESQIKLYLKKLRDPKIIPHIVGQSFLRDYGKYASVQAYLSLRKFYSPNEIPLQEKNKKVYIETPSVLKNTPFESIINAIGPTSEADFKSYQEKGEEELRSHTTKDLFLFLGNGISLSYGSLSWPKTLTHMMHYLKPYVTNQKDVVSYIGNASYSKALLVQSVLNQAPSSAPFSYYETIYSAIYNKKMKKSQKNSTLFEVASLMHRRNISAVTFNYDQYLEDEYYSSYRNPVLNLEFKPLKKIPSVSPVTVYHVHGFMPKKYRSSSALHSFDVVLNEDDYDIRYFQNSWCKTTIAQALKNNTCLLVGLSLSDLYLRSLFRACPKGKRHYSLMCDSVPGKRIPHQLSLKDRLIISGYFLDMNVFILWEPSYPAIGAFLKQL
jgi:hypothetical protein